MHNQRGQIAIFVALTFQVLFVFFAMVVNIGLLVHHKINLQNSVDLAAYYGAMKQAESLNAIAHINYQIRQSWKLQMFRYRHLGMMGEATYHPYNPLTKSPRTGVDDATKYLLPPMFCLMYPPMSTVAGNENQCMNLGIGADGNVRTVNLPQNASIAGNAGLAGALLGAVIGNLSSRNQQIANRANDICRYTSLVNFFVLSEFIMAHKMDVYNRKKLMFKLANDMSLDGSIMKDLDGASVRQGVLETFKRNLTYQNARGFTDSQMEFYNSMSDPNCRGSGNSDEAPAWLSEINVLPLYVALDTECKAATSAKQIVFIPKFINSGNPSQAVPNEVLAGNPIDPLLAKAIQEMSPFVTEPDGSSPKNRLFKTSVGFEKNPWCMSYVRTKAWTQPKIPFLPISEVRLYAQAFAKPFGGTIGPWDKTQWSATSNKSDGPDDVDSIRPPRVDPSATTAVIPPGDAFDRWRGDFSRYVGDNIGSKSKSSTYIYAKEAYERHARINVDWWIHLYNSDVFHLNDVKDPGDILAWDTVANQPGQPMRNLEIAVLSPDQFDAAYYSIEPDFYRNYFQRLKKREPEFGFAVRGDLGSRKNGDQKWEQFSVKDQVEIRNPSSAAAVGGTFFTNTPVPLTFYLEKWHELLTSFQAKNPEQPVLDADRFGKCANEVPPEANAQQAAFGNCIGGGRTGYSVKIVDGDYLLRSDLRLGGSGTAGSIRNQWK